MQIALHTISKGFDTKLMGCASRLTLSQKGSTRSRRVALHTWHRVKRVLTPSRWIVFCAWHRVKMVQQGSTRSRWIAHRVWHGVKSIRQGSTQCWWVALRAWDEVKGVWHGVDGLCTTRSRWLHWWKLGTRTEDWSLALGPMIDARCLDWWLMIETWPLGQWLKLIPYTQKMSGKSVKS